MAITENYPSISRAQYDKFDYENVYPYHIHSDIYKLGPLVKIEGGGWVATSYELVNAIFRDKNFITMKTNEMATQTLLQNRNRIVKMVAQPPLQFMINRDKQVKFTNDWLVFKDPPDHTRIRKLAQSAFTPVAIKSLLPRMKVITSKLLDELENKSEFDLIQDFALPLPVTIISDILGVSPNDRHKFKTWSEDIVQGFSANNTNMTKEKRNRTIQAIEEAKQYLENEIKKRESNPGEDIISYFVTAKENNDSLTHEEIIITSIFLLMAGHETTVNLITNTIYSLMTNYDQFEMLNQDKSLVTNTIEESLRFDPPAPMTARTVTNDLNFKGFLIKKKERVDLSIFQANRDPEVFENPNVFDITRKNSKNHLSFGQGIHYCLGAPLARAEAEIAFSEMIERFPTLKLKPSFKPRRNQVYGLNSFEKMLLTK